MAYVSFVRWTLKEKKYIADEKKTLTESVYVRLENSENESKLIDRWMREEKKEKIK